MKNSERSAANKLEREISDEEVHQLMPYFPSWKRALKSIGPQRQMILQMRLGIGCDPQTLQAVGKKFGMSSDAIWFIEIKAIRKLKKAIKRDLDRHLRYKCYLDGLLVEARKSIEYNGNPSST